MDGSGPKFFSLIDSVLGIVLAASLLAWAGPRARGDGSHHDCHRPNEARIDKTFAEAGGVALWTKADGVTRFDEMTVTTLP
jgi:hypothetical protein